MSKLNTHDAQAYGYQHDWIPDTVPDTHWSLEPGAPTLATVMADLEKKARESAQVADLAPYVPPAVETDIKDDVDALYRRAVGLTVDEPKVDTLTPQIRQLEINVIDAVKALMQYQNREYIARMVMQIEVEKERP